MANRYPPELKFGTPPNMGSARRTGARDRDRRLIGTPPNSSPGGYRLGVDRRCTSSPRPSPREAQQPAAQAAALKFMIHLLCLLLLACCTTLTFSQDLATWTFEGAQGGALTPSGFWWIPETGLLAGAGNATLVSGGAWSPSVSFTAGVGGSARALSTTQYLAQSSSPGPVFLLDLSAYPARPVNFSFFSQRSSTGPTLAQLQFSLAGALGPFEPFGAGNLTVPMAYPAVAAGAALPLQALGAAALAVRVRGLNASGSGSTFRIDNVTFSLGSACPAGAQGDPLLACFDPLSPSASASPTPSIIPTSSMGECLVSTLAGSGNSASVDGAGTAASFTGPAGLAVDASGLLYVIDRSGTASRVRTVNVSSGMVSTITGATTGGAMVNGAASLARFWNAAALAVAADGAVYIADANNWGIRRLQGGTVTSFVGCCGSTACKNANNGVGTNAGFQYPYGVTVWGGKLWIGDSNNNLLRSATIATATTETVAAFPAGSFPRGTAVDACGTAYAALAGIHAIAAALPNGTFYYAAGNGTVLPMAATLGGTGPRAAAGAVFNSPWALAAAPNGDLIVVDSGNFAIRRVTTSTGTVTTLAGRGVSGYSDGLGTAATFVGGLTGIALDPRTGDIYVSDTNGFRIRRLQCPFAAQLVAQRSCSAFCSAGTFAPSNGSLPCQPCPSGHYCPSGTSSWANLNCGRGNYCPTGSASPLPCPYQLPPSGGWGALQVQGPAFLVETAGCLNHCFWNFTSGDGMLSHC